MAADGEAVDEGTAPELAAQLSAEEVEERAKLFDQVFEGVVADDLKKKSREERGEAADISLTYSELDMPTMDKILQLAKDHGPLYKNEGVFLDLGSGAGKPCLAAALLHQFEKVVGIECQPCLHAAATAAKEKYKEVASPENGATAEGGIEFVAADFSEQFDTVLGELGQKVTLCLACATCFGPKQLKDLERLAELMPESALLIALTQGLPESLLIDIDREPKKRRSDAMKKALNVRGVEKDEDAIELERAANHPNGWKLLHKEVFKLDWGSPTCFVFKKYSYPYCSVGDWCMATPTPEENDPNLYVAKFSGKSQAIYFDDPFNEPVEVGKIHPFTAEDKKAALKKYGEASKISKAAQAADPKAVVKAAFEHVKVCCGGSLGAGEKINYTTDAGAEAKEGALLVHTMLGNFGAFAAESKAFRFMAKNWQEQCEQVDADNSRTISETEAIGVWNKVKEEFGKMVDDKLARLQNS